MRENTTSKFLKILAVIFSAMLALSLFGCEIKIDMPNFGNSQSSNATDQSITISESYVEIAVGGETTLTATVSDGSEYVWISSDESVATVDQSGVVRGVAEGYAEISAIASDSRASCLISVIEETVRETEIFLPVSSAQLKIGEMLELTAIVSDGSKVTWSSSAPQIATVDDGIVVGVAAGTAVIAARANGAFANCVVTVVAANESATLTLSQSVATVKAGQSFVLTATASDGAAVTWMSDDTAIATVNQGVVTGVSVGTTVISAWTAKATAQCVVTVTDVQNTQKDGYTLVWQDEFDGNALDESKWIYMLGVQDQYGESRGPWFWGNNEQQYYTRDAVTVSGGELHITAKREDMPEGRSYSSARIATRDKAFWTYGYFETRMKTPAIRGMWPAFWMLPQPSSPQSTNNKYGGWAANGEIDIMEARGRSKYYVDTTLHFGNGGSSTYKTKSTRLSSNTDEWHVYALEWKEDYMAWFIDGTEVMRMTSSEWWSASAPDSQTAPFDVDFYLLLNLAVGGNYDGGVIPNDDFVSAEMTVDYVRVYKAN